MKFIVTKNEQSEYAVVIEAIDSASAVDRFHDGYGEYEETSNKKVTKITVVEAVVPAQEPTQVNPVEAQPATATA